MKGICFIEPLHGKTVKGIKVQTRRIINPQPLEIVCSTIIDNKLLFEVRDENDALVFIKPRYKVGDILYLKEPYAYFSLGNREPIEVYRYGKTKEEIDSYNDADGCGGLTTNWKNKLFMPAYAARHFIKITAVRAERLQEISDEDCIKEGIWFGETSSFYYNGLFHSKGNHKGKIRKYLTAKDAYRDLINSIDGKDTWNNNPWVWVYDYELIDRKEVQL